MSPGRAALELPSRGSLERGLFPRPGPGGISAGTPQNADRSRTLRLCLVAMRRDQAPTRSIPSALSRSDESPGSGDDQSLACEQAWVGPDRTVKESEMALDNEQIVRRECNIADNKDREDESQPLLAV